MFRLIMIITIISTILTAKEHITVKTGIGISDSNKKACKMAIENAKREALEESQVIVYSEFESNKQNSNGKVINRVKKNLNIHSYGKARVIKKLDVKLTTDADTYQSTCKIRVKIAVDTALMKSEIRRNIELIKANQDKELANIEADKLKALVQKRVLQENLEKQKKYQILKKALNRSRKIKQTLSIVCDSSISPDVCRAKLNTRLIQPAIDYLSKKYDIAPHFIGINSIKFADKPTLEAIEGGYRYNFYGEFIVSSYLAGNPYERENRIQHRKSYSKVVTYNSLMWQNQPFKKKENWDSAKKQCQNLKLMGYSDWRLPTKEELKKLYTKKLNANSKGQKYHIKKEFTDSMPKCCPWFWSASEMNSAIAWNVNFGYGIDSWFLKSVEFYVICVR